MVFAEAAPWPILWKGRVQDRKNNMDCQRGVTTISIVSRIGLDSMSCVWKSRLGDTEWLFIKLLKSVGMVEDRGRECCRGLNKALRTMGKGGRNRIYVPKALYNAMPAFKLTWHMRSIEDNGITRSSAGHIEAALQKYSRRSAPIVTSRIPF